MESSGERGKILVSSTTKEILEENYRHFIFEKKSEIVHCKSINTSVEAYFVTVNEDLLDNDSIY